MDKPCRYLQSGSKADSFCQFRSSATQFPLDRQAGQPCTECRIRHPGPLAVSMSFVYRHDGSDRYSVQPQN